VPNCLATHVDNILKGSNSADLPVEQASPRSTTAKAFGLMMSQSLLFVEGDFSSRTFALLAPLCETPGHLIRWPSAS